MIRDISLFNLMKALMVWKSIKGRKPTEPKDNRATEETRWRFRDGRY